MFTALSLLLAIAIHPAETFAARFPGSSALRAAGGEHLVHASGFVADMGARAPEEAARAFLAEHGGAFGVASGQSLVLDAAPAAGEPGAVRFHRTIGGLPVFAGDLVVGVDAQNRVFLVNSGRVGSSMSGRHAVGDDAARRSATSFARRAAPATVSAGWRALADSLRAVYRVDFIAQDPPGDWRVYVDGETGRALFRENLRDFVSAASSVFEVSPVETAASLCPVSGEKHSTCASPLALQLPNLVTGSDLAGTQTTVYDCKGNDAPAPADGLPGVCSKIAAVGGAFNFTPDSTYASPSDDFAGAMAYYHLDKHVSFFKQLDPTLPPAATTDSGKSRAVRGSLPALVNAHQGGAPLENAFYSGLLDAMVFGQGASTDYAYDATVMYHELTHGAVFAWGGFNLDIDALGAVWDPKSVNEGTADSMAVSETGRSAVGAYVGATESPAKPYLRDMDDPGASRTCQGDLVPGTKLVSGLGGEEHDDGEIWNGFYWEIYQGLKTAGIKACNGNCEAGPALQYKAMQLAGGTAPTFGSYWQTFKSAASALFPSQPQVASYVDCVAKRRKMDKCDRTVPVYAGESKIQQVKLQVSAFQAVLPGSGTATPQFSICSAGTTQTAIHVRKGEPVKVGVDAGTSTLTFTDDGSAVFAQACSGGAATFQLPSAGTWYLLVESPDGDTYRIDAGTAGIASRPASSAAPTCAPPTLQSGGGSGGGTGGGSGGANGGGTSGGSTGGGKGGCSSTGAAGLPALLALAGLLRRRARRALSVERS